MTGLLLLLLLLLPLLRLPACLPVGLRARLPACSCQENVAKECQEEASIPAELAAGARAAGAVSYTSLQVCCPHCPTAPHWHSARLLDGWRLPGPHCCQLAACLADLCLAASGG
jgi:hypothetical protein